MDDMMKMKERLREMIVVMACDFLIDEPYTPHSKDLIKRRQDVSFWRSIMIRQLPINQLGAQQNPEYKLHVTCKEVR